MRRAPSARPCARPRPGPRLQLGDVVAAAASANPSGSSPCERRSNSAASSGYGGAIGGRKRGSILPRARAPRLPASPTVADLVGNLERRMRPVQLQRARPRLRPCPAARRARIPCPACSASRNRSRCGSRSASGLLGLGLRGRIACGDFDRVVAIDVADHLPAVGLEALGGIVGEPAVGIAIDGNPVVVPEARPACPGPRCRPARRLRARCLPSGSRRRGTPRCVVDDAWSARLKRCASSFSASAMPTALAKPWPSGPVVVSTPGVCAVFGVAGGLANAAGGSSSVHRSAGRSPTGAAARTAASSHDRWKARTGRGWATSDCSGRGEEIVPQHLGDVGHAHRHARDGPDWPARRRRWRENGWRSRDRGGSGVGMRAAAGARAAPRGARRPVGQPICAPRRAGASPLILAPMRRPALNPGLRARQPTALAGPTAIPRPRSPGRR